MSGWRILVRERTTTAVYAGEDGQQLFGRNLKLSIHRQARSAHLLNALCFGFVANQDFHDSSPKLS